MGRRRKNQTTQTRKLFSAVDVLGLHVVREVTEEAGREMVILRKAREVWDGETFLGYQLLGAPKAGPTRNSVPTSCVLSGREREAAAGLLGLSTTIGLTEAERESRRIYRLGPECDLVERACAKLAEFAPRYSVGAFCEIAH